MKSNLGTMLIREQLVPSVTIFVKEGEITSRINAHMLRHYLLNLRACKGLFMFWNHFIDLTGSMH